MVLWVTVCIMSHGMYYESYWIHTIFTIRKVRNISHFDVSTLQIKPLVTPVAADPQNPTIRIHMPTLGTNCVFFRFRIIIIIRKLNFCKFMRKTQNVLISSFFFLFSLLAFLFSSATINFFFFLSPFLPFCSSLIWSLTNCFYLISFFCHWNEMYGRPCFFRAIPT